MIIVCQENLYYVLNLQKQAHNKRVKPRSYISNDKVWLNSKYIKTKWNQKLEAKFFELFRILYSVRKQAYKLELFRKEKIHDIFYVLPLE